METNQTKTPKAIGVDGIPIFNTSCVWCLNNDVTTDGEVHCKYCGVLCEPCASSHQRLPKKGHWAMKLKAVVQPVPKPTFTTVTECESHHSEKINRYCIDCGELLCMLCLEDKHAECATETVDKMSGSIARAKHIRDARLELEDIRLRNKKASKSKRMEMKYLATQADEFVNNIIKIRQKFNKMFDIMLASIVEEKNDFCNIEAKVIEKHVLACKDNRPAFDNAKLKLDEAYKSGSKMNVWVAVKKLERLVNYYDRIVADIEADKCDVKFEFVPSQSLTGLLQEAENIGKMNVSSSRLLGHNNQQMYKTTDAKKKQLIYRKYSLPVENPSPWLKTPRHLATAMSILPSIKTTHSKQSYQAGDRPSSRSTNRSKSMDIITLSPKKFTSKDRTKTSIYLDRGSKLKLRPIHRSKRFVLKEDQTERLTGGLFGEMHTMKLAVVGKKEIAIPEDKLEQCITGSTFLRNGRLVLVDYNNKTLKLYTSDIQLVACMFVEERPWDVTSCDKSFIAVSYPFINTIEVIETGPELLVRGKIYTDRKCHGVAFHMGEKWLYVACGEGLEARLQAYSLDGHARRIIIPENGVLHEPAYLAMSQDCKRVFLSDLDNGIVGFDTESGAMICQYRDAKVKRFWDLTTDLDGHVFVITTEPDCLYVLMGDYNAQLLTTFSGDKKVCSVSYDPITKSLAVSRWKSDEVEMYRVLCS